MCACIFQIGISVGVQFKPRCAFIEILLTLNILLDAENDSSLEGNLCSEWENESGKGLLQCRELLFQQSTSYVLNGTTSQCYFTM